MKKRIFTYHIPASMHGHKISEYLKSLNYSEKILASLRQEEAALSLDNIQIHMNHVIDSAASVLTVSMKETPDTGKVLPVMLPLDILYEDEDILVINKSAGIPIHPSRQNYEHTLGNAVAYHYQTIGINTAFRCINRLDKDTSGLTIIAKNKISAAILYSQMQNRKIYREYTAIVCGQLSGNGTISLPIGKSCDNSSILRFIDYEHGKKAVTHYKSQIIPGTSLSLVHLHLDTGRTHQIRVHMKAIGHPLIGDKLYNPDNTLMNRQALHAQTICFTHPYTGKELTFTTALPDDMLSLSH